MKNFYVVTFRIIVDGIDYSIETVSGMGYDPNIVKRKAEESARKDNPQKQIASVLIEKKDMDLEEYKKLIGGNPNWLGGNQD